MSASRGGGPSVAPLHPRRTNGACAHLSNRRQRLQPDMVFASIPQKAVRMSVLEPFNPRHCAASIMALAHKGSLPEAMVSAILDVPVPRIDMRYDEGKALELKRMSRLERVFDALLQEHNVMAVSDNGGLRFIGPADRLDVSRTRGLKRLDTSLRGMMAEAKYFDPKELTNTQVTELHNYAAWLDALRRSAVPNGRQLRHAMPIDTRFTPPAPPRGRARLEIVHPALGNEDAKR